MLREPRACVTENHINLPGTKSRTVALSPPSPPPSQQGTATVHLMTGATAKPPPPLSLLSYVTKA